MTFVLAIDQGTSATKAILVDAEGAIVARGSAALVQSHPAPGWVEQHAEDISASVNKAVATCLSGHDPAQVVAVGISNQRETLLLWDRRTGVPVGPALSWQDQRTVAECQRLRAAGAADLVRRTSGLPLDPMFSAVKATWLLDRYDPKRIRSGRGELCLGTVDSWLLSRLGARHLVEVGNAARTQLLDIRRQEWAPDLLALFRVPVEALPEVVPSNGPFPEAGDDLPPLPPDVPVTAVLGDSHAALFAHGGWRPGLVKATYGTGSSVMGLTDATDTTPDGLGLTIAWNAGRPAYAVEGNIRSTGATLTWLGTFLGRTPGELAALAAASSDGVHLVPAFGGLGAPWWDDDATGLLTGLTLGTGPEQVARAALESIAFQVEDVVAAVDTYAGGVDTLLADGGPTTNPVLMQLQADTSGRIVERAELRDLSALGVAHLAGLTRGIWSWRELEALPRPRCRYYPRETDESRRRRTAAWHRAVARSRLGASGST